MFSNPFQRNKLPEHMTESRAKRLAYNRVTFLLGVALVAAGIAYTPLIMHFHKTGIGFGMTAIGMIADYTVTSVQGGLGAYHAYLWSNRNATGFSLPWAGGNEATQLKALISYAVVTLAALAIVALRHLANPHSALIMKADARWATADDLREMEKRKQFGVHGGRYAHLGYWAKGIRAGQTLRLIETVSVLCLAPPGTGKTAGYIIPSLLAMPGTSLIIFDPKPELYAAVAGHLSKTHDIYMLDWSVMDQPDKGIYYPRFNFLSPKVVPKSLADRDTYIDSMCKILIPDKKEGGDTYFQDKGRAALAGFLHLLIAKVNDAGDYTGIPDQWVGKEASMPMLIDWLAIELSKAADAQAGEVDPEEQDEFMTYDDIQKAAGADAGNMDPLSRWLKKLVDDVAPRGGADRPGASQRAFNELSPLITMADKERSGVLGTMDQALIPFKNAAVKQRTEASDFIPADFRGVRSSDGWKPIALFICSSQDKADAFAQITALLLQCLGKWAVGNGPGEQDKTTSQQLGPTPVCFVLDEFPKLPAVPAIIELPDLGRSKKAFILFAAQDDAQIGMRYSEANKKILYSTTAVKVVLAQNEPGTIELIRNMVGETTIQTASKSFSEGTSAKSFFDSNVSISQSETKFLRVADIASMKPGTQLVIVQNFMTRPIMARQPLYFQDPEMSRLVYHPEHNPGMKCSIVLPKELRRHRMSLNIQAATAQKLASSLTAAQIEARAAMQRPQDIAI